MISTLLYKWCADVVLTLGDGPLSWAALYANLKVSAKVLSDACKRLEHEGFLTKETTTVGPVRVRYSLTPLGLRAVEPLRVLASLAPVRKNVACDQTEPWNPGKHRCIEEAEHEIHNCKCGASWTNQQLQVWATQGVSA